MSSTRSSRRTLLKAGAAAVAAPYFVPTRAFGANDRVQVGIIGLGGRAKTIVESCGKFETVSEVDETRLDYLIKLAKPVVGPRAKVTMRYANGTELRLHLAGDWGPGLGAIFIGDDGKLEINRNKIAANPKELLNDPKNPGPITKPETQYHIEDWLRCIKTRERCNADIDYGLRSTTLCYLVNIVREVAAVGQALHWDPDTERFTNSEAANQSAYIQRPRRPGYELPALI